MSDSDDENYVTFGVPLDPLDEDNLPKKKPMTLADQCAYDSEGRRRFHGAFTGGFSAGYFNSVGSRDGWRPQQFKSSRSNKKEAVVQRPEDFMDDEDTSQFGIAPKGIRATSDYMDHGKKGLKRERINQNSDGPIPGTPVLKELLRPMKDTIGITLLKKMGWKPGQGVGSRVTKKQKAKIQKQNEKVKVYGCAPQSGNSFGSISDDSDGSDDDENVTFAPDDYEPFRCNPKDNYFGIGYSGLDRRTVLSDHVNLFDVPAFSVQDKQKKLSIRGQAFGVGAFEADDDDIYERDDLSRYDFSLGPERDKKSRWSKDNRVSESESNNLEGFVAAANRLEIRAVFPPPDLPNDFVPFHTVRKSRFHPPIEPVNNAVKNKERRELTATDRARILEDTRPNAIQTQSVRKTDASAASNIISRTLNLHGRQAETEQRAQQQSASWVDKLRGQSFVKGGIIGSEHAGSLKELKDFKDSPAALEGASQPETEPSAENDCLDRRKSATIFPDPDKQRRFEQFLELLKNGEADKLASIQPLSMTDWHREIERSEFEQAASLSERLSDDKKNDVLQSEQGDSTADRETIMPSSEQQMRDAAKMKMFGKLTRVRIKWKPASIVCKRFNVPEPDVGCATLEPKKTARSSIFSSMDWSVSRTFLKEAASEREHEVAASNEIAATVSSIAEPTREESSFEARQPSGASEKMRSFEASYEKVFGKDIQDVTETRAAKQRSEDSRDEVASGVSGSSGVRGAGERESEAHEAPSVPKDKSDEKKDLFKAIFLSSSESESEAEENVATETMESILIGKAPAAINAQRNTSPPRGIFAKLDLDSLIAQPRANSGDANADESGKEPDKAGDPESRVGEDAKSANTDAGVQDAVCSLDVYGPALPTRLARSEKPAEADAVSPERAKPVFKSVAVPKAKNEETLGGRWVESRKSKKSKKESKKEKKKHKERKSPKRKKKSKKRKH